LIFQLLLCNSFAALPSRSAVAKYWCRHVAFLLKTRFNKGYKAIFSLALDQKNCPKPSKSLYLHSFLKTWNQRFVYFQELHPM